MLKFYFRIYAKQITMQNMAEHLFYKDPTKFAYHTILISRYK